MLHDPLMGGGPEWGKTRRPWYNDKMRRPASRFHDPSAGHQDGPDPVMPRLAHAESGRLEQLDGTSRSGTIKAETSGSTIISKS